MHGNRNGTSALPEQRDVVRIAAEGGDIVADPLEGHHLIEEACVPRNVGGSEVQEAEARHAILHRDEDHLLLGYEGFVIVNVESCRSGIEATCAQGYCAIRKREREKEKTEKKRKRKRETLLLLGEQRLSRSQHLLTLSLQWTKIRPTYLEITAASKISVSR